MKNQKFKFFSILFVFVCLLQVVVFAEDGGIEGDYIGNLNIEEYLLKYNGKLAKSHGYQNFQKQVNLHVYAANTGATLAEMTIYDLEGDTYKLLMDVKKKGDETYRFSALKWLEPPQVGRLSAATFDHSAAYLFDFEGTLTGSKIRGPVYESDLSLDAYTDGTSQTGFITLVEDFNKKKALTISDDLYAKKISTTSFVSNDDNFNSLDQLEFKIGSLKNGHTGFLLTYNGDSDYKEIYNHTLTYPSTLQVVDIVNVTSSITQEKALSAAEKTSLKLMSEVAGKIADGLGVSNVKLAVELMFIIFEPDYISGEGSYIGFNDDGLLGKNTYPYQTINNACYGSYGSNFIFLESSLGYDAFLEVLADHPFSMYLGSSVGNEALIQSLGIKAKAFDYLTSNKPLATSWYGWRVGTAKALSGNTYDHSIYSTDTWNAYIDFTYKLDGKYSYLEALILPLENWHKYKVSEVGPLDIYLDGQKVLEDYTISSIDLEGELLNINLEGVDLLQIVSKKGSYGKGPYRKHFGLCDIKLYK